MIPAHRAGKQGKVLVGCAGWTVPTTAAAQFPGSGSHLERYALALMERLS